MSTQSEATSGTTERKVHGEFALITSQLVAYDETNHPVVDPGKQQVAVDLAHAIGQQDGTRPGVDEHSLKKVLPSQEFVANSVEVAMTHLGADVDKALSASRAGRPLSRSAREVLTRWQRLGLWARRNAFTILAVLVVGIVEYVVGTQWTQRVFDLSDDTAHVVALAMPVIFGLVGFALAHAVLLAMENRVERVIRMSAAFLIVGTVATVVCAGLVISETVGGGATGGGGVSGGVSGGSADTGESAYTLVKLGVYVSLLLTVMVLVMVLHLMDLWRDRKVEVRAAADAARTAVTQDQVADGNRAYLASFLDVIDALAEVRTNVVTSYVAGVRANLSPRIADTWTYEDLHVSPRDPAWVKELEAEIKRLEASAAPRS